jgi:xanthine dehydrogenase accessory factor
MSIEGSRHEITLEWLGDGRRVVAATLVDTQGSAPLDPGAVMLVDEHENIEGSVTGGCVEGALVEEARAVLAGEGPRLKRYGISDELAGEVGLMCGGAVWVFVEELGPDAGEALVPALGAVQAGEPAAIATLLDGAHAGRRLGLVGDRSFGSLGVSDLLDHSVRRDATGLLAQGTSVIRRYGADGAEMGADLRVYIQSFATPPQMIVFGAIDFSAAMAVIARELGYDVTICDARAPFAKSSRFSRAADVVVEWPDRFLADRRLGPRDAILVFTHDPKFDEPALIAALATGAGYVGALGSRQTHADRVRRLREAGVAQAGIERIAAPCGLDIGPRTPAETAVSILGEIVALRSERGGGRLADTRGHIRPRDRELAR